MDLAFIAAVSIGANLDNFGVALAYAMLRKTIPIGANLIIGAVSSLVSVAGYAGASFAASYLPASVTGVLSGGILVGIGLWGFVDLVRQVAKTRANRGAALAPAREAQSIGAIETGILSVALAINAGAGGLAGGFAGKSAGAMALGIGICSVGAIFAGQWSAKVIRWNSAPMISQALGALMLVAIGIAQLP